MQDDARTEFVVGRRLPSSLFPEGTEKVSRHGGSVDFENQILIMALADFKPEDTESFAGPGTFRLARMTNFLIVSISFSAFSFDLIWAPSLTSSRPGEGEPESRLHPVYSFIMTDADLVVRAMRTSSVSPVMARSIHRAQLEVLNQTSTSDAFEAEVMSLFKLYPRGIPDNFFHDICALGD